MNTTQNPLMERALKAHRTAATERAERIDAERHEWIEGAKSKARDLALSVLELDLPDAQIVTEFVRREQAVRASFTMPGPPVDLHFACYVEKSNSHARVNLHLELESASRKIETLAELGEELANLGWRIVPGDPDAEQEVDDSQPDTFEEPYGSSEDFLSLSADFGA